MNVYAQYCDDFYVNMTLNTAMPLPSQRETILHFFDRIRKSYPAMRNFYARDRHELVLETDKAGGSHQWCSIEPRRILSGQLNPESVDVAVEQHRLVLELAPYHLSVTPLDCEAIDLLFGFDFTYRGNHNELLADVLGVPPAFERVAEMPSRQVVHYEPSLVLSFDSECRLQCRISTETRTTDYHVRTGEYPEDQLSVYVTARHYGGLPDDQDFSKTLELLKETCFTVVDRYVLEGILQPLAKAIALG
ncbi:MAG: hypothetical protein D6741_03675 [Planctomycetota bacterium]|nr:MAG: hypothetical protein D6741_03675 [Planctomycetota bacterium]